MNVYKDAQVLGGVSWYVTFLVGLFGNFYIISTITVVLKQRRNVPNALILILSITDLVCVLCTYIIPGVAYAAGIFIGGRIMCNIQTFVVVFINMLSVLISLGVVFERYYAVADPYAYQEHMMFSVKKILVFLAICVTLSVGISLPTVIESNNVLQFPGTFCMINIENVSNLRIRINIIFYIIVLSIFIFSNIFCNTLSIFTVRKMTSFRQQYASSNHNAESPSEEHLFMRLCVVTCLVFLLLWIPLLVYFILALSNIEIPNWYTMLSYRLVALNCVVNPWLYPLLRKRFRHAFYWHVTTIMHYVTLTVINSPSKTLAETVSESSLQHTQPPRSQQIEDEHAQNIMINIAQRNLIDYVDAPPAPTNNESKGHESNSCDVTMQSASNEKIVDKKSSSCENDSSEFYEKSSFR